MQAYEVAKLDDSGVIIDVIPCSEADYRTDPIARTVRLDRNHDMRDRIGAYKWDFNANTFIPLSIAPFDVAERDNNELVEGFVEVIEDLLEHISQLSVTTNEVVDAVSSEQPLQMVHPDFDGPLTARKKIKKVKEFKMPERTARTIKQFRRQKPRREVRITDTTLTTTYEVIDREPEEI